MNKRNEWFLYDRLSNILLGYKEDIFWGDRRGSEIMVVVLYRNIRKKLIGIILCFWYIFRILKYYCIFYFL